MEYEKFNQCSLQQLSLIELNILFESISLLKSKNTMVNTSITVDEFKHNIVQYGLYHNDITTEIKHRIKKLTL